MGIHTLHYCSAPFRCILILVPYFVNALSACRCCRASVWAAATRPRGIRAAAALLSAGRPAAGA
eukprot:818269-Alexandrium_andersonii.AAC.1